MTPAAQRHLQLENQLNSGRELDSLSEEDEDSLLEEMGDVWWDMTDAEHEEANHRAKRKTYHGYKALRGILWIALIIAATGGWMVGASGKPKTTLYFLIILAIIISEFVHWILNLLIKSKPE